MTSGKKQEIRTRPCPDCCICGTKGVMLYRGLQDRLFAAPGRWNFKRCPNPDCGLVWLDPMPIEEDIGKAYETYYTHKEETKRYNRHPPKKFYQLLIRELYVAFSMVVGLRRQWRRVYMMYLDHIQPGRLLEIGCGNGQHLALFQSRGWIVEGQEVDQKAAKQIYNRLGIKVHLGAVEYLGLREETYDAIIMNHVIEHVHDPVGLLMECRRLLKPGGLLVAVTPNSESRGHRVFCSCWRGLEPPRHLRLFSLNTLKRVAQQAGFMKISSWTTAANARGMARVSLEIMQIGRHDRLKLPGLVLSMKTLYFQLFSSLIVLLDKHSGEECVLRVTK